LVVDDYRTPMTRDEFAALSIDPEHPISSLWDPLIDANPRLMAEDFGDAAFLAKVTPGMRLFLVLGVFDGQVCNGGITQFFWNCRATIFAVQNALNELGEMELLAYYDRALDALAGNRTRWQELRAEYARSAPSADAWQAFRRSYDLLDLSWFDKAYFPERGFNAVGEWVVLREGLSGPFSLRLVEYVRARPGDFITR
jgi:hypothetical protein